MNLEMQQFKAEFFKALSHPLRIKILEVLAEGEMGVNEIQNKSVVKVWLFPPSS